MHFGRTNKTTIYTMNEMVLGSTEEQNGVYVQGSLNKTTAKVDLDIKKAHKILEFNIQDIKYKGGYSKSV